MTWLVSNQRSQESLAKHFKDAMEKDEIMQIAGAHDGMAGLVGKEAGFEALYLSGAALTASKGIPDIGLLNSTEVSDKANEIVRATDLPLLVDVDNGFGGPLNIARTVKELLESRVAAIQLEDQSMPKKCGHLNGKQLITTQEMTEKIKMVKKIAPSLILIARTDARGVEGMDEALKRAKAYSEAGADAIFPEAMNCEFEFTKFSEQLTIPLLANMTEFGKTPYFKASEFQRMGYSMVIYPVTSLRVAAKAYERAFHEINEKGTQKYILDDMQTRQELYDLIRLNDYEKLDNNIARTVLPKN